MQILGSDLYSPDTISTTEILNTLMTVKRGGTYSIAKNFSGTIRINTTDAVTIDGSSVSDLSDVQISVNASTAALTIKNLKVINESGGGILFATAGKQGSGIGFDYYGESSADLEIKNGSITTVTNMGAGDSIGNIKITGGKGSDTIKLVGNAPDNSIDGGAGKYKLYGANACRRASANSDVFIYKPNEGKDTIMDFAAGTSSSKAWRAATSLTLTARVIQSSARNLSKEQTEWRQPKLNKKSSSDSCARWT